MRAVAITRHQLVPKKVRVSRLFPELRLVVPGWHKLVATDLIPVAIANTDVLAVQFVPTVAMVYVVKERINAIVQKIVHRLFVPAL